MLRSPHVIAAAFVVVASTQVGFSAESGDAGSTAKSGVSASGPQIWMPAESGLARFRVSFGRIQFDRIAGRDQQRHSVERADGAGESYWVRPAAGGVEAEYQRLRPGVDQVSFRCEPCGSLRVTRESLDPSNAVRAELVQPAEGWLTLTFSEGENAKTLRAPSLWHLYLVDRDACQAHVSPILEEMVVAAEYEAIGDSLPDLIVERAKSSEPPARAEALGWIHDLSDPSFKVRRTAEEQLRRMGPSLVAWVRLFPVDRLDREQCDRLRELVSRLEASSDDRPERLAAWLADDPWIWVELLSDADADVRRLAAERIELLTGESVDASAEHALVDDASVRTARELCQQDRGSLR